MSGCNSFTKNNISIYVKNKNLTIEDIEDMVLQRDKNQAIFSFVCKDFNQIFLELCDYIILKESYFHKFVKDEGLSTVGIFKLAMPLDEIEIKVK